MKLFSHGGNCGKRDGDQDGNKSGSCFFGHKIPPCPNSMQDKES